MTINHVAKQRKPPINHLCVSINLSRIYSGSSGYHILLEHMAAAEINITNTREDKSDYGKHITPDKFFGKTVVFHVTPLFVIV